MNCQDFEPFLFAYVDGEFDGPEKADADEHLCCCQACRSEVEEQRAFKRRLREVAASTSSLNPPAPAALRESIGAALAKERAPRRLPWVRPTVLVPAGLAAAASVAVVVWLLGASPEQTNALVAASIAHHQGDLPLDVQDVSGEVTLKVSKSLHRELKWLAAVEELDEGQLGAELLGRYPL